MMIIKWSSLLFMNLRVQNFIVLFFEVQKKEGGPIFLEMLHVFPGGPPALVGFSSHSFLIFLFKKTKKTFKRISGKSSWLTDYFNLQTWSCGVRLRWAVLRRISPGSWKVSLSAASPSSAPRQPALWLEMQHRPPSVVRTCRGHSALPGCLRFCFFDFFCASVGGTAA